jgi:hypothetical protein
MTKAVRFVPSAWQIVRSWMRSSRRSPISVLLTNDWLCRSSLANCTCVRLAAPARLPQHSGRGQSVLDDADEHLELAAAIWYDGTPHHSEHNVEESGWVAEGMPEKPRHHAHEGDHKTGPPRRGRLDVIAVGEAGVMVKVDDLISVTTPKAEQLEQAEENVVRCPG